MYICVYLLTLSKNESGKAEVLNIDKLLGLTYKKYFKISILCIATINPMFSQSVNVTLVRVTAPTCEHPLSLITRS